MFWLNLLLLLNYFLFKLHGLIFLKKIWSHFIFIFYGKMQIYGIVLGERVVSMALLAPEYFFIPFWQGWEINIYRMECDYPWAGVQSSLLGALFAKELHEEGGVTSSFPSEVSLKYNLHFCSAKTHRSILVKNSYIKCHLETQTWGQEMKVLDCAWLWILFTVTQSKEFHLFPHAHTEWLFFLTCWSDTVKL